MAMVQLESYGFTTVENPLSDGGNFTTGPNESAVAVPSSGVCEATALNMFSGTYWSGSVMQGGGTWPADQYSEITVLSETDYMQATVRGSSSAQIYYALQLDGSTTNTLEIRLYVGGGTALASVPTTHNTGDVFRLVASGSTLSAYKNGSLLLSVNDSTISSGSPGFSFYIVSSTAGTQISLWAGGGNQAVTPTFSLAGTTLTITSSTSGGTIYYTTNGTTPTHSSSSISNGGTITVSSGQTVKAFESASNYGDSAAGTFMVPGVSVSVVEFGTELGFRPENPTRITARTKIGTNLGTRITH